MDLTPIRILDAVALLQKVVGGAALAVVGEEALVEDAALGIQHVGAWIGQAEPVVTLRYMRVEYAEFADHPAAAVGKQGVGDAVPGGVSRQQRGRIRADRVDGDVVPCKVLEIALQLDQLRFAEASPGGAAVEQDEGPAVAAGAGELDGSAGLVRQREVGDRLADGRTGGEIFAGGITAVDEFGHVESPG